MIYVLTAVVMLQTALMGAAIVFAWRRYVHIQEQIETFLTPVEEGKPSPAAQVWEAAADMLSRAMMARLSTAIMTGSSALSRASKAVEGAVIEDVVAQQSPLLAGLLDQFPTLKKTLKRNPQLLDIGLQAMQRAMQSKAAAQTNGHKVEPQQELDLGRINRK